MKLTLWWEVYMWHARTRWSYSWSTAPTVRSRRHQSRVCQKWWFAGTRRAFWRLSTSCTNTTLSTATSKVVLTSPLHHIPTLSPHWVGTHDNCSWYWTLDCEDDWLKGSFAFESRYDSVHLEHFMELTFRVVLVLVLINIVAQHWTHLILGWVTICGQVNHLGM